MILELMDYFANLHPYCIGDFYDIKRIQIEVISGDEVATVFYKDGKDPSILVFDSSKTREMDFYDGEYTLYEEKAGIDRFEEFNTRITSYDMLRGVED